MARVLYGLPLLAAALVSCSSQQAAKTQSEIATQTKRTAGEMNRAVASIATSDTRLKVQVVAAITAQAGVNVLHVSTDVHGGIVTLSGTVPSASIEQTIVKAAAGVSGVKRVVNRLRV